MDILTRQPGPPEIIIRRNGAGLTTALLDGTWRGTSKSVRGLNAIKLRLRHAQADSTSISIRCSDNSDTDMTSADAAPIASVRQNATAGSGETDGGRLPSTGTVHVIAAADPANDIIFLALGGTVDKLLVEVLKTGGTAVAGNWIEVEFTPVEG